MDDSSSFFSPDSKGQKGHHPHNDYEEGTYPPQPLSPKQSGFTDGQFYYDEKQIPERPPDCEDPCSVNKGPCFPLKPCKSPRLITVRGQKPIFSVMPPSCPIRETIASILAKKPPANCRWHQKNVQLYHDYCMPSVKFRDPVHQRITFVDHVIILFNL